MRISRSKGLVSIVVLALGVLGGRQSAAQAPPQGSTEASSANKTTAQLSAEEVIQLVQAGIPEDVVIAKVKRSGKSFDVTTDQLLQLKKAGAGDNLIKLMSATDVESHPASNGGTSNELPAGGPSLPDEVGLHWAKNGKELVRIEGLAVSNMRTGSTLANAVTLGVKKARINAQLKGARAELRIKERQPQFYLYLPEDASVGDYLLLRLAQRLDVRQIEIGEKTVWKTQAGVDQTKQVDFTHKRLKNRIYLITPSRELDPGEYGFYIAAGVELKKASGRIYDFGID